MADCREFGGCSSKDMSNKRLEKCWAELPVQARDELSNTLFRLTADLKKKKFRLFDSAEVAAGEDEDEPDEVLPPCSYEAYDFLESCADEDEVLLDVGAVRNAFATFFARALEGYKPFTAGATTAQSGFRCRDFIAAVASSSRRKYLEKLFRTQCFSSFIERRDPAELRLFDELVLVAAASTSSSPVPLLASFFEKNSSSDRGRKGVVLQAVQDDSAVEALQGMIETRDFPTLR